MSGCTFGSLPVLGIWQRFCWHLIFLTHTGQIRTLPYTRAPWIRSPRRCSRGDRRSCSLNEVMKDPVTKTQSHFYLLMHSVLMQAANLKWHKRVDVTKKEDVDCWWNIYGVNGYWSLAEGLLSMVMQCSVDRGEVTSQNGAESGWSRGKDQ